MLDEQGRMLEFGEFPQLETERLVLRRLTIDDAEFYLRHFSDPSIVELTAFEAPKDLDGARAELMEYCIDNFTNNTGIRWGIVRKGSSDLIGTCGFFKWIKHAYHAEIGYDLRPAFRNQGIMTEALTAMIDYAFKTVGLNRLQALTDPGNEPSIKLLRKLGFKHEGTLRDYTYFRGKFMDDLLFSLLSRDWRSR